MRLRESAQPLARSLLLLEVRVTARLCHDDVEANRCSGVEARRSKLAGDAIAINHLLTIAALASDGVGVARRTAHAVLAEASDAHTRADKARSLNRLLNRLLVFQDEHFVGGLSSVTFPP